MVSEYIHIIFIFSKICKLLQCVKSIVLSMCQCTKNKRLNVRLTLEFLIGMISITKRFYPSNLSDEAFLSLIIDLITLSLVSAWLNHIIYERLIVDYDSEDEKKVVDRMTSSAAFSW